MLIAEAIFVRYSNISLMKRLIPLLALLVGLSTLSYAQKYKNPEQYLREYSTQNRKIHKKNLLYLKSSIKGDDPRKVARYREMVIEQLKDSRTYITRVGPYGDQDVLNREYIAGLTLFIDAFENDFGIAEELTANRFNSYDDLKKYYDAVFVAEGKMMDANDKMEAAEDYFAKMNFINLVRDEEVEEEYEKLDEVTLYTRDMTLSFYRAGAQVRRFIEMAASDNKDSLQDVLGDLRKAIKESKAEIAEYANFEGNSKLYKATLYYLEELSDEVNNNLGTLADQIQNDFLDEKEYKKVQKNYERFQARNQELVEEFLETRSELIMDYLPED